MPPSLLSAICYLRTLSVVLSVRMASVSQAHPLTLALSLGRGNRLVDANHALPVSRYTEAHLVGESHIFSLLPLREKGWG